MTKDRELLKADIEKIDDKEMLEKIRIFILGIHQVDANRSLPMYILLSIVTCGIYSYYWHYALGNRLAENAPRYGMSFTENGTTVLLWRLFGVLICGIGPLIAMHIVIKNTNALAGAYLSR